MTALVINLFFLTKSTVSGQNNQVINRIVSVHFHDVGYHQAIQYIDSVYQIKFTYFQDMLPEGRVNLEMEDVPVRMVLSEMLKETNLGFTYYQDQIIFFKRKPSPDKITFRGTVISRETYEPVEYATVQIYNQSTGSITDHQGNFELEISRDNLNDTVLFSAIGFHAELLTIKNLYLQGMYKIYLDPRIYEIKPVLVRAKDVKTIEVGNNNHLSTGSLYLDTHGQQVALFVPNEAKIDGTIQSIYYFLSKKGNTSTPFRIRVYEVDKKTGKPENEMFNQIAVVKPQGEDGWYKVDVTQFDLNFPKEGCFFAIEGIFPDDIEEYYQHTTETSGDEDMEYDLQNISFGQRIGYNSRGNNDTWHFSLSNTWFQISKKKFNVMIYADVRYKKQKRHKRKDGGT